MTVLPGSFRTAESTAERARGPHLLHAFPSFGLGGVSIRIANIINLLGPSYRHTITAMDGCYDARVRLDSDLSILFPPPPAKHGSTIGMAAALRAVLRAAGPDLLLTYNWGSIEWALANCWSPICPHVHFESGFGIDEADGQLRRRALFRRIALHRATRVVVPSLTLVDIATRVWKLDPKKVLHIPNGVDWRRFAGPREPDVVPGFERRPGELVVGTLAPLRPEKNIGRLLRAFATLKTRSDAWLLIVGDGPERAKLKALAASLGIASRTVFSGHIEDVEKVLGWFDIFAMSSDTEQMPNSLLQAMAAGLPVAATDVGDIRRILPEDNRPFAVPQDDDGALALALQRLIDDRDLRHRLGAGNGLHVRKHYGMDRMLAAYRNLYDACLGRSDPARGPCAY